MARKLAAPIPRVALTLAEAAAALGVGTDFFNDEIRPDLQLVRRGRRVLVPLAELERWVNKNVERAVAEEVSSHQARL